MKGEGRLFHYAPARREAVVSIVRRILESQADVRFAYLHGSFVTDGPFRDVDVAVYLDEPHAEALGLRAMDLNAAAEAALSRELDTSPPPVDVRVLNEAPLGFCYQTLRGGHLLMSRNEPFRIEWVVQIVARYLDMKPLRDRALKEAMTACR